MNNHENIEQNSPTERKTELNEEVSLDVNKKLTRPKLQRTPEQKRQTLEAGKALIDKLANKLNRHTKRNLNVSHINHSLYHLLCNPYTFVNAYVIISKNKGALTEGVKQDKEINKFFGQSNAISIANEFREQKYKWQPVRRVMIPKPGKTTKRPIDTPTQKDRIVQEAIRGILEAIYEPEFRALEKLSKGLCSNYGFRPGRSTWEAIDMIQTHGKNSTQAIEGDIAGAYNNVNHGVLLSILGRRIKDKKFLKVIKGMLESGIMHKGRFTHSLTGTPQGGIVSPLLFNIYMFEFDKYIYNTFIVPSELTTKAVNNPLFKKYAYRKQLALASYRKAKGTTEAKAKRKELMEIIKLGFAEPSQIPESLPKISVFARYADDWVLTITGPMSNAISTKEQIAEFLDKTLHLQLDPIKTAITRIEDGFNFLGFHLQRWSTDQIKLTYTTRKDNKTGTISRFPKRTTSRQIYTSIDNKRVLTNLTRKHFCSGPDYFPVSQPSWSLLDEFEIVLKYRQVFVGLVNYYRNVRYTRLLNRVSYILHYSCAKTIAHRQKITIAKVFKKYGKNLNITRDVFTSKQLKQRTTSFIPWPEIKSSISPSVYNSDPDYDPFKTTTRFRTKFKIYFCCCICLSEREVALHHINSIRSIKDKKRDQFQYFRSILNRVQIPVCRNCHKDITYGRYSDKSPVEFYDEFLARF